MAILASDDFVRADNVDIGASWSPMSDGNNGGDNFTIVSNSARGSAPTAIDACEQNDSVTWPADQWAEATLGTVGADGLGAGYGVALRGAPHVPNVDQYRAVGNGSGWALDEFVNAITTASLGSGSSPTFAATDRVYLEAQGTTLVMKKNTTDGVGGSVVTTVSGETSLSTGKACISMSTNVPSPESITLWKGGDFTVGTAEQEGYRGRNDDGSESTATWIAAQDTAFNATMATPFRLRTIVNTTLDVASSQFQLEYRKSGEATWIPVDPI